MNSDYIGHGLNADKRLDDFVRCARCGFPCKLSRDVSSRRGSHMGWGLTYTRLYLETTIASSPVLDDDMVSARNRITTETGIAFFTEDGDTLITEG